MLNKALDLALDFGRKLLLPSEAETQKRRRKKIEKEKKRLEKQINEAIAGNADITDLTGQLLNDFRLLHQRARDSAGK